MKHPININKIEVSVEFYAEVISVMDRAQKYLLRHPWCKEIKNGWIFTNVGNAICIFLFDIEDINDPEDNLIWVIAGDFPPMYQNVYNASTTLDVVKNYIDIGKDWIKHVEAGDSLEGCYPLDVDPNNSELVELLGKKLKNLENIILPNIVEMHYENAFQY